MKRLLGRTGLEIGMIGVGCWAIGGPHARKGQPVGWGAVNDADSVAALRRAFELGCTYFDTADIYGCGHSERLIAEALGDVRDEIVIGSKAGYTYVEETREAVATDARPSYIREACERSLRRLKTDRIDVYMFHLGNHDMKESGEVLRVLEELVAAGKIRSLGWSTDDPSRAELFAASPGCSAIQQGFNVLGGNAETLGVCEKHGLTSLVRNPLEKGLLTGKFNAGSTLAKDDIRSTRWNLVDGEQARQLKKVRAIADLLMTGGRTMTQGALCWLLARSPRMVPIPGFKNVRQVEENLGAMRHGPLGVEIVREIEAVIEGEREGGG